MSKTDKPARPRKGGSYTRDPKTGKLARAHFTRHEPAASAPAAQQADAPADTQTKEA